MSNPIFGAVQRYCRHLSVRVPLLHDNTGGFRSNPGFRITHSSNPVHSGYVKDVFDAYREQNSMHDQILLPTDGSETADSAIDQAIDIAEKYNAEFHALYVVDKSEPVLNVRGSEASFDRLEKEGEDIVDDATERAEQASISSVTGAVQRGEPAETILQYVDANEIDLVVMGTHGRSGLDRHLLGSVAETVVRHAAASVLTVRKNDSDS